VFSKVFIRKSLGPRLRMATRTSSKLLLHGPPPAPPLPAGMSIASWLKQERCLASGQVLSKLVGPTASGVVCLSDVNPPHTLPNVVDQFPSNPTTRAIHTETDAPCCAICLESTRFEPTARWVYCNDTGRHAFHRDCLALYLETEVTDGRVANIKCPDVSQGSKCGYTFDAAFIGETVRAEVFSKYEKFVSFKQNPNVRECPSCGHLTIGSPARPDMECETCHQPFCYDHANAHVGIPCRKFLRGKSEGASSSALTRFW
jgi:hypothetical protein